MISLQIPGSQISKKKKENVSPKIYYIFYILVNLFQIIHSSQTKVHDFCKSKFEKKKMQSLSSDLHNFPLKFTLVNFLSSRKIIILYKLLFSQPIIRENKTGGKNKQVK